MCGIIAYIGSERTAEILLNGLRALEYRGYDSVGMAILSKGNLYIKKDVGKVEEVNKKVNFLSLKGNIGIGHTRWSTHGEPNELNAHPHQDCKNEISLVHNGIIENYHELKELLIKEGHKILSQTDTEIIAHLIEKFYKNNLEEAVLKALKLIGGAFGLAIMHKDEEKIIAARRGSPLIIGIGQNEMFVTSDVSAILNHTKKVVYLEDNQIAVLTKENYKILDLEGNTILNNRIQEIRWSLDQIEKGGYKHFMLKEIFDQPKSIENTIRGRIQENKINLDINLDIKNIGRIIITACGTSWHSALIGKYLIEKLTNIPVEVDYASEFRYRNPVLSKGDLLIAISQSGETADTLAALKQAKQNNAKTLGIVNAVGSQVTREVQNTIYLHAGPEIGVASTKAFTCQITALLLFALYLKQQKGEQLDKNLLQELQDLPNKIQQILENTENIKQLAQKYQNAKDFLYLGRGINFPTALEGALKLKEISYIHAEGYPAAEMKHGPIALVDQTLPVVFIAPKDNLFEKTLSNMQEIKARSGKIIAVTNALDETINKLADDIILVPKTSDELQPILNIIPLQLLAYYIADLKGIDMDKPRNLAKSVTVE